MNPDHHHYKKPQQQQHHRSTSSCAACKFLKRRCVPTCIFAPYFRSDEPKKFAKVHKVFGASNVSKILFEVAEEQREDTVNSLAFEAEARLRDPVYGCIGAIALLQRKMVELQHDLAVAKARLAKYNNNTSFCSSLSSMTATESTIATNNNIEGMMMPVLGGCDGNYYYCSSSSSYNIPEVVVNNEGVVMVGGDGTTSSLVDECWGYSNQDVGGVYNSTSCCCAGGGQMNGSNTLVSTGLHNINEHHHLHLGGLTAGEFGQATSFPL